MAAVQPMSYVSLYVGDLQNDVTESHLLGTFNEFTTLTSIRVCRDATGHSLGYGYVNFSSHQDAMRAIEAKNHSTLNGKAIRVMWSIRDPGARKSGVGNLFVKNLSDNINNAKLQELFQKFGTILSAKVSVSHDGKSRGHGFVQFQSEDSALAAIKELDGITLEGKTIYVGKFVRKMDRIIPSPDAKYTNLYMKNLDPEVSEEQLKDIFSKFGNIVSLAISKDTNGVSKGFGFVNFDNHDDAKRAVEALNGSQLGSKELYVARAQKKAERLECLRRQMEERKEQILKYQGSNVYVKNLDGSVTDEQLGELFKECGRITSEKVMRDDKGISKGFGFVCFTSPDEAIQAVNKFQGFMFHGRILYVAIAQRKADRKAHLQMLYAQQMTGLAGSSPVIPGGYAPFYYPAAGVVPQVPVQPGLFYQPLVMSPAWRPLAFAPSNGQTLQPSHVPRIQNKQRQYRQYRGRMSQGGGQAVSSEPHVQQSTQPNNAPKESSSMQQARTTNDGRAREETKGSGASSYLANNVLNGQGESYILSSMLAASSVEKQKQIVGERLYPLVSQQQPDLAAKITGMLLEMDNTELLLLLDSPESLSTKVGEAVEVLKQINTSASSQETVEQYNISAEVAVN